MKERNCTKKPTTRNKQQQLNCRRRKIKWNQKAKTANRKQNKAKRCEWVREREENNKSKNRGNWAWFTVLNEVNTKANAEKLMMLKMKMLLILPLNGTTIMACRLRFFPVFSFFALCQCTRFIETFSVSFIRTWQPAKEWLELFVRFAVFFFILVLLCFSVYSTKHILNWLRNRLYFQFTYTNNGYSQGTDATSAKGALKWQT